MSSIRAHNDTKHDLVDDIIRVTWGWEGIRNVCMFVCVWVREKLWERGRGCKEYEEPISFLLFTVHEIRTLLSLTWQNIQTSLIVSHVSIHSLQTCALHTRSNSFSRRCSAVSVEQLRDVKFSFNKTRRKSQGDKNRFIKDETKHNKT